VREHRVGSSPTSGTARLPANSAFFVQTKESPWYRFPGLWQQCGSSRPRKGLLHRCGGLIPHVRQHVGVGVEGFGYGRMPKHLGDDLRVHVAGKQQRGARVGVGRESGPAAAPPASGGLNLMCIGVSRPLSLPQRCPPGRCATRLTLARVLAFCDTAGPRSPAISSGGEVKHV
jgi:hypothetical protein